jgi:dimethylpropiothetin dethiomethylase
MNAPDHIDLADALRITDRPDWGYLLREIHELYRRSGAGGSSKIRSHQRAVREALNKVIEANPPVLDRAPEDKPVTIHLKRALDNGRQEVTESVCRAVESVLPELSWLYGYEKVPRGLSRKYAYAEIAGPEGPVMTEGLIIGLVLFAPKCTYPAHAHEGLTESYYVLSGTVSENDDGVWAPGSLIFNPPGRMHRITVSDREPALLVYAWQGRPEKLTNQKMVFTRKKTKDRT